MGPDKSKHQKNILYSLIYFAPFILTQGSASIENCLLCLSDLRQNKTVLFPNKKWWGSLFQLSFSYYLYKMKWLFFFPLPKLVPSWKLSHLGLCRNSLGHKRAIKQTTVSRSQIELMHRLMMKIYPSVGADNIKLLFYSVLSPVDWEYRSFILCWFWLLLVIWQSSPRFLRYFCSLWVAAYLCLWSFVLSHIQRQ